MDVVAAPVLLRGAWYSLEQCGHLLSDAVTLYRGKSYSSSVALAMIGREELGKHLMLLEEWRKAEGTGQYPGIDAIQRACADHVDKQRRASLSFTFMPENTSAFGTAIRTKIEHKPQDTEYQEAERAIQTAVKSLAKRTPDDRHAARMCALYVDLQDSGLDWSRPSQLPSDDAKKLLNDAINDYNDAINDYAGQWGRLNNPDDQNLRDALEAWRDRPALPQPVWTE